MSEIRLKVKGKIGIMIEAEVISPNAFAGLGVSEIEALRVWQGPTQLPLSDFFEVEVELEGSNASKDAGEIAIIIEGDASRVKRIGEAMKSGKIEVRGPAGMHLGCEMSGGSIHVQGDAGSWSGREMKGGMIRISGNCGDHIGSAYRGSWRGMTEIGRAHV